MVEVILRKEMRNLGKVGDIVKVKDGYARNYLIPKGYAYLATEKNKRLWEQEKNRELKRLAKEKEKALELAKRLEETSITISAEANDEDTLYGSITDVSIINALEEEGIKLDKSAVVLTEPIKKLGVYTVQLRIHPDVVANLKLWVVRK